MTRIAEPTTIDANVPFGVTADAWLALGATRNGTKWLIPERDADGNIIGRAIRPDRGRKHFERGGRRGLTMPWPLLPEAGATQDDPILIVEGQTDAAAAIDLGFVGIGRPSATGGTDLLKATLRGRHVCIVAENDDSGIGVKAAHDLADALSEVAASVKVLVPTDGVKDLRAWANAPAPLSPVELRLLIESTPLWTRRPVDPPPSRLRTIRLADVKPELLEWLWPGRIPLGKLTMIFGDPGLGKSFLTMDIAARVSTGNGWPDAPGQRFAPGGVILLTAEDGLADTVRPRLDAAGADVTRIEAIDAVGLPGGGERALNLAEDLRLIEERIEQRGDVRAFIVDPVSAYCGRADSHTNAEVRGMLAPLAKLAERHGVALIAVSHLNKSQGGKAIYRATGSLAFVAAARAAWLVVEDDADPAGRLLLPAKMNVAAAPSGAKFSLHNDGTGGVPCLAWDAEPVNITADDALAALSDHDRDDNRSERESAAAWLIDALTDGPRPAKEIKRDAKDNSIAERTLKRAKVDVGAEARRVGFSEGATWFWGLPGTWDDRRGPAETEGGQPSNVAPFTEVGPLRDGDDATIGGDS